ncbi:MAG: spermidine synthase [Ornithinimicrobium sp.]
MLCAQDTDLGEISLRRRLEPVTGRCIYEAKLGEEFLMSSLFTAAEEAMADLALDRLDPAPEGSRSVLVGGLGLGYTAVAALRHPAVGSLTVIEALSPVVEWHERRLLPCSDELLDDTRTQVVHADFFATVAAGTVAAHSTFASSDAGEQDGNGYDAVLVDIDHAPDHLLHERHQGFYSVEGLRLVRELVRPGGVFALWSDRAPHPQFTARLGEVFGVVDAEVVTFANPLTRSESANTVYLAAAGQR